MHTHIAEQKAKKKQKIINNNTKVRKKDKGEYIGFMCPNSPALDYSIVEILLVYAEKGCKVHCRDNYSIDHINHAIKWGLYASALEPDAGAYA